jgi:hypothetical protein
MYNLQLKTKLNPSTIMPTKSIPTLGDPNWGIPLNNHLSQLQNPSTGSINTWLNITARPTLTIDDQGKTGVNLDTGYVEQWTGTAWINLTKMGLFTVNSVFTDLVNINPANTTRVYTAGYWTKDDFGGGVFEWDATSSKDIDGGRYFASKYPGVTAGRWVRKLQVNVNVLQYGALPDRSFWAGNNGNYGYGGIYYRSDVPQVLTSNPLSSRFSTLADAKAWYPRSVAALTDEINNCAIQSTIEFNTEISIPEGVYICNRSIQLMGRRKIYGAGSQTIIKFNGCNGLVPKVSVQSNDTDANFQYLQDFSLRDLSLVGDANLYYNTSKGYPTEVFDDSRCGINYPYVNGSISNNTSPLIYSANFSNINISNFAGHGVKMLLSNSLTLDNVNVQTCSGHGIFMQGNICTTLTNCWVGEVGPNYASFRVLTAATLISCNGNDAYNTGSTWGIFGKSTAKGDDSTGGCSINMINCNLEASPRCIELRGYDCSLIVEKCSLQVRLLPSDPYYIFDEGYSSNITIIDSILFSISTTQALATIKVKASDFTGSYIAQNSFGYTNSPADTATNTPSHNYKETFYTVQVVQLDPNTIVIHKIPGIDSRTLRYGANGEMALSSNTFHANKLYIGDNSVYKNQPGPLATSTGTPLITSGDGSPEGVISGIKGSFYMRTDGGAGTTMYVKESGTDATGWVAK